MKIINRGDYMKVKINNNIKPKQYLLLLIVFSILFLGIICFIVEQTMNYRKVSGVITDIQTTYNPSDTSQQDRYVIIEYEVDSNKYETKQQKYSGKEGSKADVYIKKCCPSIARNEFNYKVAIFGSLINLVVVFILFLCYIESKKNN